ncbi:MAG: hypothetical protein AAFP13_09685 [Pseudomonadota bacterium]
MELLLSRFGARPSLARLLAMVSPTALRAAYRDAAAQQIAARTRAFAEKSGAVARKEAADVPI